jgi:hypothetical protein
MLPSVLFISTAILYVFSILNSLWFKIKLPAWFLKPLKTVHIILIPVFTFPLVSFLLNNTFYYKGHYTNTIVFWSFLISGFLLAGFGIPVIKNKLLKTYLYLLQYIWFLLIAITLIMPMVGLLMSFPVLHFALPPGNVVFSNEQFRVEKQNENLNFIRRRYMKRYYLVPTKGLINRKTSFSLYVKTDSVPNYSSIEVESSNDSSVYVTFRCDEDIIFDENDSLQNSITKKIILQ